VDGLAKSNHRAVWIRHLVEVGNQGLPHSTVFGEPRRKDLDAFWVSVYLKERRNIDTLKL
jgi:hypothetical protein